MRWSYERAGVDLDKVRTTHSAIAELIQKTYSLRASKSGQVLAGFGHYASIIDVDKETALALHCDGCGTKVLVAQLMNKFDTIGIDCVAMCVNDLICLGVEPTTLIDYIALEQPDENMVHDIMKGLVAGAEKSKIAIIGGETAIIPDIIKGAVPGRGFDLAAFCLGFVRKDRIIMGNRLEPNDVILGIESSGLHSNGFSLARKVLLEKGNLDLKRKPSGLQRTLGEELLEPTLIYLEAVIAAIENVDIHAVAHITGGAFTKLRRFHTYANVGFHLNNMPEPQPIFKLIQRIGQIADEEMYRTFNMGIGLCIMTPRKNLDTLISSCEYLGFKTHDIGNVIKGSGIRLNVGGRSLIV